MILTAPFDRLDAFREKIESAHRANREFEVMKFARGAALAALLTSVAVSAQTVSNQAAFNAAIATVRADSHNVDKFAEPMKIGIIGQPFKLTLPAKDYVNGGFKFDYKDGQLILDLAPATVFPKGKDYHLVTMPSLTVSDSSHVTGRHIGQNAYGAKAEVTDITGDKTSLAIASAPKAMLSPMATELTKGRSDVLPDSDWWTSIELPPAQAKAMAMDTVAVVEGRYANLANGKLGECATSGSTATLDSPTDSYHQNCFIGADIERIAFVKRSTGEVIKEWTLANSPRLGATLWRNIKIGMTRQEAEQAEPSLKNGSYDEANHVMLNYRKDVVASADVSTGGMNGKSMLKALTERYGQPTYMKCITNNMCEAKWTAAPGVALYQTMTGLTYQASDAPPPVGFAL